MDPSSEFGGPDAGITRLLRGAVGALRQPFGAATERRSAAWLWTSNAMIRTGRKAVARA